LFNRPCSIGVSAERFDGGDFYYEVLVPAYRVLRMFIERYAFAIRSF